MLAYTPYVYEIPELGHPKIFYSSGSHEVGITARYSGENFSEERR